MDNLLTFRKAVLTHFGAGADEVENLIRYNHNHFNAPLLDSFSFPLPDEAFVPVWQQYAREVEESGSIAALAKYLVQLQFPVRSGISQEPEYLAATRQGKLPENAGAASGLHLQAPHLCRIVVHPGTAGRIPLIIAGVRGDFVALVRALTRRNEPQAIPDSMGACMVAGYNNWHRISLLRNRFYASTSNPDLWPAEFQRLKNEKELYQDRFIILSSGPYSGVHGSDLGVEEEKWLRLSLAIRREHECAHYFSRRVFSSMRNNLLDELIADYFGISIAIGHFRADWLLRFFGLESFPAYRRGGRLENYRGDPQLSEAAFAILQRLVVSAAANLESFDRQYVPEWEHRRLQAPLYAALASLTVEQMAATDGKQIFARAYADCIKPELVDAAREKEVLHASAAASDATPPGLGPTLRNFDTTFSGRKEEL